eukprot:2405808-Prymnesium_polylepis.2
MQIIHREPLTARSPVRAHTQHTPHRLSEPRNAPFDPLSAAARHVRHAMRLRPRVRAGPHVWRVHRLWRAPALASRPAAPSPCARDAPAAPHASAGEPQVCRSPLAEGSGPASRDGHVQPVGGARARRPLPTLRVSRQPEARPSAPVRCGLAPACG